MPEVQDVRRFLIFAREAGWPRVVLAAWENLAGPFEYIYRSFPVGIRIQCDVSQYSISGSCCIQVQGLIFIYRLWKKFLDYRWITSKFLQCQWPTKASTTTLGSKSRCKSSPGRTPLEQQQNAELKFSASNKEDDDSEKPRNRENIALAWPSEEEAVNKRQGRPGRGYSE